MVRGVWGVSCVGHNRDCGIGNPEQPEILGERNNRFLQSAIAFVLGGRTFLMRHIRARNRKFRVRNAPLQLRSLR
jgi:hypothetical protein